MQNHFLSGAQFSFSLGWIWIISEELIYLSTHTSVKHDFVQDQQQNISHVFYPFIILGYKIVLPFSVLM